MQQIIVGQPEAAGQEGALARRQAVHPGLGLIAQHQALEDQPLLDLRAPCALMRVSVGGRKPTSGSSSRLASIRVEP